MTAWLRNVLVVVALLLSPTATRGGGGGASKDLIPPLIDWVVSKGGFVHEALEIRRTAAGYNGMFTKQELPQGTMILEIPREVLITGGYDEEEEYGAIYCPTAFKLADEWKLGEESEFAPYTRYLLSQDPGELPSAWSLEGKTLLHELLAQTDHDPTNDLPPEDPTGRIDPQWYTECNGSRDRSSIHAALYLLQRGWDEIMIPVYDMMTHRNGPWLNTETRGSVHELDRPIRVYASRLVDAGEELYTTYNFCEDCQGREFGYGTAEIVRDYGFVETFPQRWFFSHGIAFELDRQEGAGQLELTWLDPDDQPTKNTIWFMSTHLQRLDDFGELTTARGAVPDHELGVIRRYRDALATAMVAAIWYACGLDDNRSTDSCTLAKTYIECRSGNASCPLLKRYDELNEQEDPIDYTALDMFTCDQYDDMPFDEMEEVDVIKSHYQDIAFVKNPENDNVCFSINEIIQICGSYRPQYHEMVVHNTARFLTDVKRVLFVGGGDSMLLHEIIKYPSIEFVVGLELDQFITRYSFKHMGTQPHFDNEKVQWWYGDAAKSLLMLPADYFGSFDMVLVDLSETVMSFGVTDELDILQALTLLLKPDGIFVKNELYMEQLSSMFRYSLQIDFPDIPTVCSQCLVLGSNKIDFLNGKIRDHNRETLYVEPLSDIEDSYEYFHDYRHNDSADILCKRKEEPEPIKQTRSPGILMVVEVEEAGANLKDSLSLLNNMEKALVNEGLHPMSNVQTSSGGDETAFAIMLQEGYVAARVFPSDKYVAIDIHLWSSFDKHEAAKKSLVKSLLGRIDKSSSYRIVAGGMFGISTWKEDEKSRGPRAVSPCSGSAEASQDKTIGHSVGDIILKEAFDGLVDDEDVIVAVLCGEKGSSCTSVDVLEKTESVAKIVPLWTCQSLGEVNEFQKDGVKKMLACERELSSTLYKAVTEDEKFRAIIVDPSTSYSLSRIVYEILREGKEILLDERTLALSVMLDKSESWRRNLVERFRSEIIYFDPEFRAEVVFNSSDSTVELGVTSSATESFVRRLVQLSSVVEMKTGLEPDVRLIQGGMFLWQWYIEEEDWEWPNYYLPQNYDQKPPLDQWLSQKPLGYQRLSQLEKVDDSLVDLSTELIETALKDSLASAAEKVMESDGLENADIHVSTGIGEGCVIVATWPKGNCIALWDGREHIDFNWFSHEKFRDLSKKFVLLFRTHIANNSLAIALVDEQPRGTGRVVNFLEDLEPRVHPHWAKFTA